MSSSGISSIEIAQGVSMPNVGYGLGTARYKRQPGDLDQETIDLAQLALKVGYRHLDAAESYGNEEELGEAMKKSNVARDSYFLTTKVHASIGNPKNALKESLRKLQVPYVDQYLIHAPFFSEKEKGITLEDSWLEMEKLQKEGLAKSIGVSNFEVNQLERILKVATIKPAVNQIEWNAYLQQPHLIDFHKKHNITTVAYHPLGPIISGSPGPLDSVIEKLCKKYNKTNTQILLRWVLDMGFVAITTSSKESRMKEVLDLDFTLEKEDSDEIANVGKQKTFRKFWTQHY